jgi:Protein of unknown function (DUF3102)
MGMTVEVLVGFDYERLGAEARIVVQQRTGEIKSLLRATAQTALEIGQKLIEVKRHLGHGQWGGWLESEFGWSQDTAARHIQIAQRMPDIPQIAEFDVSALYVLSAPSTPPEARESAIALAQSGQPITHAKAQAIVQEHKPPNPPLFVPGETVAVSSGDYVGRSVVVEKMDGAIVHCQVEGVSVPLLQSELVEKPTKKPTQYAATNQQQTLMGSYESMLAIEQERSAMLEKQLSALTTQAEQLTSDLARERDRTKAFCDLIRENFDRFPVEYRERIARLVSSPG